MIKKALLWIAVFVLLLAACSPAASTPSYSESGPVPPKVEGPPAEPEEAMDSGGGSRPGLESPGQPAIERLVIKTVNLQIVVDDPAKSMDSISKLADSMDGYVVSANLYQSPVVNGVEVPQADITIRVPAERVDEALGRIRELSDRLPISENISSQDVTSDYTDLQSRLRNLEAAEAQLQDIMESANRTEDVLNVYNQLTSVREQIEVIKGQMQYYEQSAALSAISISLIANAAVQPLEIGGWEPVGVAKGAIQALINAMQTLATAAIWIVLLVIPVLLVVLLPLYLIIRLFLRWRARRGTPSSPAPSASD
jgi:hypothetical protein